MVELSYRRDIPNYKVTIHASKKEATVANKLLPLRLLFTPDKRRTLIKKLFHNDETEFDNLIDELEPVQEWQQALKKVDHEFKKSNINLHDRNAAMFTDILYARYFPDDNQIKIK